MRAEISHLKTPNDLIIVTLSVLAEFSRKCYCINAGSEVNKLISNPKGVNELVCPLQLLLSPSCKPSL